MTAAPDLISSLEEAHAAGKLLSRMKTLTHPSLLIVDEIGYLPVSRTGGMHFFQLMSRRYEQASTVLTSNKSFEEWGEIFGPWPSPRTWEGGSPPGRPSRPPVRSPDVAGGDVPERPLA